MALDLSSSPKSVLNDGFSATFETLKPQKEPEEPFVQLAGEPPKSDTKPPVEDKSGVRAQTEAQIADTRAKNEYEEAKRVAAKGETAAKEAREAAVYAEYKPRLTAPYESFKPTGDTASSLASLGLMIGMLGAMGGTKGLTSATGAMNAIAGMMTGYQEGSKEKYNKERQIFEENLKVAQQNHALIEKEFERAVKYAKYDLTGATNAMIKSSLARGDTTTANSLETRGLMPTASEWSQGTRKIIGPLENAKRKMYDAEEARVRAEGEVEARKAEKPTATSQRPYTSQDETGQPVLRMPGTNEVVVDAQGKPIRPTTAAMVTAASKKGLDNEVLTGMVDQYLAGDRSVMQGFGTSLAGQQDKAQFRSMLYKVAKDRGITPDQLVTRMAEVEGLKTGERELARTIVRVGYYKDEAMALMDQALEKSEKVKRFDLIPLNKVIQSFETNTSDPDLKQFAIANNALLAAYTKVMVPTGAPTESVRKHAYELLSTATGADAYKAGAMQLIFEMEQAERAPQQTKSRFEKMYGGSQSFSPTKDENAPIYTDQNIINDDLKKKGHKAGDKVNVIFNGKPEVWEIE